MEVPFGDTQTNVARVARMMGEFAREIQEEIDRERETLVYRREA